MYLVSRQVSFLSRKKEGEGKEKEIDPHKSSIALRVSKKKRKRGGGDIILN